VESILLHIYKLMGMKYVANLVLEFLLISYRICAHFQRFDNFFNFISGCLEIVVQIHYASSLKD